MLFKPQIKKQTGRGFSDRKPNIIHLGFVSASKNFGLDVGVNFGLFPYDRNLSEIFRMNNRTGSPIVPHIRKIGLISLPPFVILNSWTT
jgi:hypothetical protein